MDDLARLGLEVNSSGVNRARDALGRFTKSARDAERSADGLSRTAKRLQGAFALLAGSVIVGKIMQMADAYTVIMNKLRAVSGPQDDVNKLFERVLKIANDTRQPLEEVAALYQKVSIASKDLGASQSDALQFVTNVGRAMAQQGAGGAAASGALLQLSQALGGAKIQAQEFNSLIDGGFPLLQAAAKGLDAAGGSVGKLTRLVKDGKVSSREFFQAILSQSADLELQFAKLTPTISGAFSVLNNQLIALTGGVGNATGVFAAFARLILLLAENIERVVVTAGVAVVMFGTRYVIAMAQAAGATGLLSTAFGVLRIAIIRTGIGALILLAGEAVYQFMSLIKSTGGFGNALNALKGIAAEVWERVKLGAEAVGWALSAAAHTGAAAFADAFASIAAGAQGMVKAIAGAYNQLAENFNKPMFTVDPGAPLGGVGKAIMDMAPSMPKMSKIDIGGIGAAAPGQLSTVDQLRGEAEAHRMAAETDGFVAGKTLGKVTAPLKTLEALRKAADDAGKSMDGAAGGAGKMADAVDGAGGSAKKATDQFKQLKEMAERTYEETRTPQEQFGMRMNELNVLMAHQLITWDTYQRAVKKAQDELSTAGHTGADAFRNFNDTFGETVASVVGGTATIGDAFESMANRIAGDFIAANISNALGAFGKMMFPNGFNWGTLTGTGGAVGAPGVGTNLLASAYVKHDGGMAGHGAMTRMIDAAAFIGAPRYHSGGIAGLRPGEVPSILKRGETVIPVGGKASGDVIININNAPPGSTVDQRRGPDGQRIFEVAIASAVTGMMDNGKFDGPMRRNFGVGRSTVGTGR